MIQNNRRGQRKLGKVPRTAAIATINKRRRHGGDRGSDPLLFRQIARIDAFRLPTELTSEKGSDEILLKDENRLVFR